jgi:very-short-patch-repair endonuclease
MPEGEPSESSLSSSRASPPQSSLRADSSPIEGEQGARAWLRQRAKQMRAEMTPHEKIIWRLLHQGELVALNWRRQSPLGRYVLDFVSHPAKFIVEIDGAHHGDANNVESDSKRTVWLNEQGYQVLRFWNFETVREQDGVWLTIHGTAIQTKAAPRMLRWREKHMRDVAATNARLPPDGGGGERKRAGGGARAVGEEGASGGVSGKAGGPHPLSHASRDLSPIEGERE